MEGKRELKKRLGTGSQVSCVSKYPAGFTLIELMVVMALIAVLASLSIMFLKDLYDNYKVSQAAEQIIGLIRETQSKAMSVEGGKKAFGVEISGKGVGQTLANPVSDFSYTDSNNDNILEPSTPTGHALDVTTISLTRVTDGKDNVVACPASPDTFSDASKSFVFNFSAPFGSPEYFLKDNSDATNGSKNYCVASVVLTNPPNPASTTVCSWQKNDNYLSSFSVFHTFSPGACPLETTIAGSLKGSGHYSQNGGKAKIEIKFNNATRVVVVKGSGEAYIE